MVNNFKYLNFFINTNYVKIKVFIFEFDKYVYDPNDKHLFIKCINVLNIIPDTVC